MTHSRAFLIRRSGKSKPSLYPSISFTERINEWSRASTVWHSALRPSLHLSHEQRSPLPCPRILRTSHPYAEEIRSVVYELCQFKTICPCITSRMTAVPPRCNRPEVPTLSMEAACDIFYSLYGDRIPQRVGSRSTGEGVGGPSGASASDRLQQEPYRNH